MDFRKTIENRRKAFTMEELQGAMIQVKKGRIKEPNAVIRVS
jgi:hypothetical protein